MIFTIQSQQSRTIHHDKTIRKNRITTYLHKGRHNFIVVLYYITIFNMISINCRTDSSVTGRYKGSNGESWDDWTLRETPLLLVGLDDI
jgi:hypothetical protein